MNDKIYIVFPQEGMNSTIQIIYCPVMQLSVLESEKQKNLDFLGSKYI